MGRFLVAELLWTNSPTEVLVAIDLRIRETVLAFDFPAERPVFFQFDFVTTFHFDDDGSSMIY